MLENEELRTIDFVDEDGDNDNIYNDNKNSNSQNNNICAAATVVGESHVPSSRIIRLVHILFGLHINSFQPSSLINASVMVLMVGTVVGALERRSCCEGTSAGVDMKAVKRGQRKRRYRWSSGEREDDE